MAVTSGTIKSVCTLKSDSVSSVQLAQVNFTMSGTYAQADDSIVSAVATAIQNSRRNGKTVTLHSACLAQTAALAAAPGTTYLGAKTIAISTADITFELTLNDLSSEYTNATAIAAQSGELAFCVAFTEA